MAKKGSWKHEFDVKYNHLLNSNDPKIIDEANEVLTKAIEGLDEMARAQAQTVKRSLWALTCCGYVVVFEDLNEGGMPTEDGSETLHGTCFKCNTSYTVSIYKEHP